MPNLDSSTFFILKYSEKQSVLSKIPRVIPQFKDNTSINMYCQNGLLLKIHIRDRTDCDKLQMATTKKEEALLSVLVENAPCKGIHYIRCESNRRGKQL